MVPDAEFESFEWDEAKSDRTFEERGFDFEFASRVFDGDYIESEDARKDYGEIRFVCVGQVDGLFITLVWTPRESARRIVAAWPSSRQERRKYHELYSQT